VHGPVPQDAGRPAGWTRPPMETGDDHKTMTFLLREPEGGVSPPLPCGFGSLAQRGSGVAVSGRDAPRRRPWQGAGRVLRAESLLGSWRDPAVFPGMGPGMGDVANYDKLCAPMWRTRPRARSRRPGLSSPDDCQTGSVEFLMWREATGPSVLGPPSRQQSSRRWHSVVGTVALSNLSFLSTSRRRPAH
jgi:hypothetical protein